MRILFVIVLAIFLKSGYSQNIEFIDTILPNQTPCVFAPKYISTGLHEHSAFDISPDGDIALWTISLNGHKIILQTEYSREQWSKPEVASFSGQYRDEYHFFSPNGKRVYFNSFRPDNEFDSVKIRFKHWFVEKIGNDWSKPKINYNWHPELWPYSMSKNETIYGWAGLDSTKKDADIYIQIKEGEEYSEPVLLSDSINSDAIEYCPFIDPDEKHIIFGRMGIADLDGLYVSFKRNDGKWTKAIRLPKEINMGYAERFPKVSPDGQYLFFNRQILKYKSYSESIVKYQDIKDQFLLLPSNGSGDIYWVNMKNIENLKPAYIK